MPRPKKQSLRKSLEPGEENNNNNNNNNTDNSNPPATAITASRKSSRRVINPSSLSVGDQLDAYNSEDEDTDDFLFKNIFKSESNSASNKKLVIEDSPHKKNQLQIKNYGC